MSQIRLYLDEDAMRRSLVFSLRARGVDVQTAAEAGMINRRDEEHLATASASGRVLLTYNTPDYCVLHERWTKAQHAHSGIVVMQQQRHPIGEEVRRIMRLSSRRT